MKAPPLQVLREAARDQHTGETFEKALARAVKEHQGTYQDYINLIGMVRLRAKRDKMPLGDAAKAVAVEQ